MKVVVFVDALPGRSLARRQVHIVIGNRFHLLHLFVIIHGGNEELPRTFAVPEEVNGKDLRARRRVEHDRHLSARHEIGVYDVSTVAAQNFDCL